MEPLLCLFSLAGPSGAPVRARSPCAPGWLHAGAVVACRPSLHVRPNSPLTRLSSFASVFVSFFPCLVQIYTSWPRSSLHWQTSSGMFAGVRSKRFVAVGEGEAVLAQNVGESTHSWGSAGVRSARDGGHPYSAYPGVLNSEPDTLGRLSQRASFPASFVSVTSLLVPSKMMQFMQPGHVPVPWTLLRVLPHSLVERNALWTFFKTPWCLNVLHFMMSEMTLTF